MSPRSMNYYSTPYNQVKRWEIVHWREWRTHSKPRFFVLLCHGHSYQRLYDLLGGSQVRQKESIRLRIDLFTGRLSIGHVYQSIRHCGQAYICRQ